MKKLDLNLEDLAVESFALTPETAGETGTVEGYQQASGPLPTCSSYVCGGGGSGRECETHGQSHCCGDTCNPICEMAE